jgi:PAS domain S-box-containing protein
MMDDLGIHPNDRILLVEDEPEQAALVQRILERELIDVDVSVAATLAEAREYLAETSPELILADLRLPDGEGTELVADVAEGLGCPVVLMTGQGDEETAAAAFKAGVFDYVVKSPENLRELPVVVARVLREWQAMQEHRHVEECLRESESKYRTLFENSPDPIYLIEMALGRIIDCNERAAEMTGYTVQELQEMRVPDLHPPDEREGLGARIQAAAAEGGTALFTAMHHQRKDGARIPVEINAAFVCMWGSDIAIAHVHDLRPRETP